MSPTKSPSKKASTVASKKMKAKNKDTLKDGGEEEKESGLASPTSVSMQNSFIIKNADETFDAYYHAMRKRKLHQGHAGLDGTINSGAHSSTMKGTQGAATSSFGVVNGIKPAARDGHSTDISDDGLLFVFGGDRHHMPFNDLFLMRL